MSFRRSSLQFNIRRGARLSALGNPLLRLGLPRRSTVFWRGWRIAALAKSLGLAPTASGRTAGMGDGYDSAGRPAASRRQADSAMRPTAQTHTPARAPWRRSPCSCSGPWPACPPAAQPLPDALGRMAPGAPGSGRPAPGEVWIGYIFLDDFGRTKPAFLNSTGVMYPSVECILKLLYQCT